MAVHVWEPSGTLSIPAGSPRAVGTVSLSSGIKLSVSGRVGFIRVMIISADGLRVMMPLVRSKRVRGY
jgi:hypothetical protein